MRVLYYYRPSKQPNEHHRRRRHQRLRELYFFPKQRKEPSSFKSFGVDAVIIDLGESSAPLKAVKIPGISCRKSRSFTRANTCRVSRVAFIPLGFNNESRPCWRHASYLRRGPSEKRTKETTGEPRNIEWRALDGSADSLVLQNAH